MEDYVQSRSLVSHLTQLFFISLIETYEKRLYFIQRRSIIHRFSFDAYNLQEQKIFLSNFLLLKDYILQNWNIEIINTYKIILKKNICANLYTFSFLIKLLTRIVI
nr:unnamed protein product [Callosobruchus analis]